MVINLNGSFFLSLYSSSFHLEQKCGSNAEQSLNRSVVTMDRLNRPPTHRISVKVFHYLATSEPISLPTVFIFTFVFTFLLRQGKLLQKLIPTDLWEAKVFLRISLANVCFEKKKRFDDLPRKYIDYYETLL